MVTKRSISVVIPNYNGTSLLAANLPAAYDALKAAQVNFEIIVSDDASTDDSVAFLRRVYPDVIILENKVNKGFAPTVNQGIFAAKLDLVFILNSDVQLTGDYFSSQFKYFEKKDTFGVMGRIIGITDEKIQDAAKPPYSSGLKLGSAENVIPVENNNTWFPTMYLSGANALVDRTKLLALGGFDEVYAPFYGEDLDLCLRAWKVGWKCYYEHLAICRHPNSVTINKYNKKKKIKIIVYRNRFLMHDIHLSGWKKLAWNSWLGIQLLAKGISFHKTFLEGFREYLQLRKQAQVSRNKLKMLAKMTGVYKSNEEIIDYLNAFYKKTKHQKM